MKATTKPTIRDIVKERAKEKGVSLNRLAIVLGVARQTLMQVLKGERTSRPLIARISKFLDLPDLPDLYEQFLHEKRMAAKGVEGKTDVSTKEKGGGR